MKNLITKLFFFILGALVMGISAVFAYSYIAEEVGFTPTDTEWNVDNTKDALDNLNVICKNKNYMYKNLLISKDNEGKLHYYYNHQEIYPLYWYGLKLESFLGVGTHPNGWGFTSLAPQVTYYNDYIHVIEEGELRFGVLTIGTTIDVSQYKSFNIHGNYIGYTCSYAHTVFDFATDISTNNYVADEISTAGWSDIPKEYHIDISSYNSEYYPAIRMQNGNCGLNNQFNLYAMYFTK